MELNLDTNPVPAGGDGNPHLIAGQTVYVELFDGDVRGVSIELPYSKVSALDATIEKLIDARRMLIAAHIERHGESVAPGRLFRGDRVVVADDDARVVEQITIINGGTLVTYESPFGGASFTREYESGETVVRIADGPVLAVAR